MKSKVTILLSERSGLRAKVNGKTYPIRLLDSSLRKDDSGTRHTPEVVLKLMEACLYKDVRTA